jgi:hypothetical protein
VAYAAQAAARAAALGAHREAVQQYRRVLRHADGFDEARRADLLGQLAYEYYLTDMGNEALVAREEELRIRARLGDVIGVGNAERWFARMHWWAGRSEAAERHAALAVDALAGTESVELAGRELQRLGPVVAARCEIAWFAGDLPAAHRETERIWRVAPASESPWGGAWSPPGCPRTPWWAGRRSRPRTNWNGPGVGSRRRASGSGWRVRSSRRWRSPAASTRTGWRGP